MVIEIGTLEELDEELKDGLKVIFFYTSWSKNSLTMLNDLEDYSGIHPEIDVLKIDCEFNKDIAKLFKIDAVPALICTVNGKEKGNASGLLKTKDLFRFLSHSLY